jgi:thiol-disulfide isomerase/thioredoxin
MHRNVATPFAGWWLIPLCTFVLILLSTGITAQNQTSEFQQELDAGKAAAGRNQYVEAAQHLVKANQLRDGKCSECYLLMARMDIGLGEFPQALAQLEKAVSTAANGSELAGAQSYRGVVLGRQGELGDAESAFKAAVAASPQCVECRFNLGFVLLKQSKDAEGVQVLKTVVAQFAGTPRGREIQRFIADPSRIRKNYAPEFSAKLKTGEEVDLDTLKGKVVLLDFWGTWCEPCRVSLPLLKDLAAKVDPAKVAIISIDEYDAKPKWEQFVQANGMTWGQVYDADWTLHNAFRVDGFPRYYILSKDGIILQEFKGWNQNGEATINDAIMQALKE